MSQQNQPTEQREFICECLPLYRRACDGLPLYKEHEGKKYCVLHYPGTEKVTEFNQVILARMGAKNYMFDGVFFPTGVDFMNATFEGEVSFRGAAFTGGGLFDSAEFSGVARFERATFTGDASFEGTIFRRSLWFRSTVFSGDADFAGAMFSEDTDLTGATFGDVAMFVDATFGCEATFERAVFKGKADFSGLSFTTVQFSDCIFDRAVLFHNLRSEPDGVNAKLILHLSRFEKPELITFHSTALAPSLFADIDDARRFRFQNIKWLDLSKEDLRDKELKSVGKRGITSPHLALSRTCRNLAVNAEENHDYANASMFRYWAMNFARMGRKPEWNLWKKDRRKGLITAVLDQSYYFASGYGERVGRASNVLASLLLVFTVLYMTVDFTPTTAPSQTGRIVMSRSDGPVSLNFPQALLYSMQVVTLQKPDPKPASDCAKWLVNAETILGPIQIALLALAIRRKFMR